MSHSNNIEFNSINQDNNLINMYSLTDIINIKKSITDYSIDEFTKSLIDKINIQVCDPNYIKTPIFKKKNYNQKVHLDNKIKYKGKKRRNHKENKISDDQWVIMRNFETTKVQKKIDGINKELNYLRNLLNKITDENYNDILFDFKYKMKNIMDSITNKELEEIGNSIFIIGSNNMFYSKLYAKLYCDLIKEYSIMYDIFKINYSKFYDVIHNISQADPETDYDRFCDINKENEKRRALCSFIANLVNEDIISITDINNDISFFIDKFKKTINKENHTMITEEISEIIYILIERCLNKLKEDEDIYEELKDTIEELSEMNHKKYPSLNNKIVFKFMDTFDLFDSDDEDD